MMILKKYLLTALRTNLKKDSQKGNKSFWIGSVLSGLVGAWQTTFFKVGHFIYSIVSIFFAFAFASKEHTQKLLLRLQIY